MRAVISVVHLRVLIYARKTDPSGVKKRPVLTLGLPLGVPMGRPGIKRAFWRKRMPKNAYLPTT